MPSKELITELYVGYFDRAPDPVGLAFWISVLDGGLSLNAIAQDFSTQPEAQDTYAFLDALIPPGPATGGSDIEAFIEAIYDNLFDRMPEPAGLVFWTGVLEGGFPPGEFILAIIEGASEADAAILANKVTVACDWVEKADVEPGFVLSQDYIDASGAALGDVSADPASVQAGIDAADLFFQDGPSVALTGATTSLSEDADTASRTKVADIVVTDDGLGTNDLSLSGADAALFEIDGTELFLIAGAALDFETNATLDVTVEVDDAGFGGTPDDSVDLAVAVTDANDVPSVALANAVASIDEDTDTSSPIKMADIVITDDALGFNALHLSGDDADLFEISGDELFLKAGAMLNFEANPNLDVTVELNDATIGGNPDDTAALSVSVTDVNEAPTVALVNKLEVLFEDLDTSARVRVADILLMDDSLGTNVLSLSGDDASLFEIDGTSLFLQAGAVLDFETNPKLDVTLEVDDAGVGGSPDDTASMSITMLNVNEPPTVDLTNTVTSFAEDAVFATNEKVADIILTDDSTGANFLSLTGDDAGLFLIQGTELFLKAGTALDFETNSILDVTVTVNDGTIGGSPDDSAPLTVAVTDVNEAPSVALSNTLASLAEATDTASRIKVADITLSDDGLGTNVLSLTGDDAALFEIDGDELFLKAGTVLDFETNATLDVSVEVEDSSVGGSPDDSAALSIEVTDSNEAPTVDVTGVPASLSEDADTSSRIKFGDITVTDDSPGVNTLSLSGDDAGLFEIDGTELFLKAGTVLDFETNPILDVSVNVDDTSIGAGPEDTVDLSIDVTDVNEPPTVELAPIVTELNELSGFLTRFKVSDIVVTDDFFGTNLLSLSGDDQDLFEIIGAELFIKAGTVLDFETNPSLDVTVNVDDPGLGANPDDSASMSIEIINQNEAPSVSLSGTTTGILDGLDTSSAIHVGTIEVTDDGTGTNVLGLAGADAALFEIVGDSLRLEAGAVLDAATNPVLDVTVTVDDDDIAGSPDDSAPLSIDVSPGVPGLASDTTESLTFVGNASTVVRSGQIEVADADPDTPGNQPGFIVNTDSNGDPYAGVAGEILELIDVTGLDGLLSVGVIAKVDSEDFTLDNSGSSGDVEGCLGEANVFGVLTTPSLSATGTWSFDNSGATGTMEIEIKAIDAAPGGTLDFNNVDICISDDLDLTGVVLDIDAASTIEVKAGVKLTLTVEQVDDLDAAGVLIQGEGTVCVVGESDSTDAEADTTFGNLRVAEVDLSAVTLDAGDSVLEITANGAEATDGSDLVDGDGDRVAQTIIGSVNNDAVSITTDADDGDGSTLDVITRLGADSGDIGALNHTPTANTPPDTTPEVTGDVITRPSAANIHIEVDAGYDQVDYISSSIGSLADSVTVSAGAEFYTGFVGGNWIANASSSNDGIAVIEADGSANETIDVSDTGGANGWSLIGAPDGAGGDTTTLIGSDNDDYSTLVDGLADGADNDGEEDTHTGNDGEDRFLFNIGTSVAADVTYAVEAEARDYEDVIVAYTDGTGDDVTDELAVDVRIGNSLSTTLLVNETTAPGVDFTSTSSIASAIAAVLNVHPDIAAAVDGGNPARVIAYGENGLEFNFNGIAENSGVSMDAVVGGDFTFDPLVDADADHTNDAADANDDDRGQVSATFTGTIDPGEIYEATVVRGDGTSLTVAHTATLVDTADTVMDALAVLLNAGSLGTFIAGSPGAAGGILPAPGPGELVIQDAGPILPFVGADDGGVTLTVSGVSTVTGLSSSSILDGTETSLDDADADVITDFMDADDVIDFDALPAGDNSNYDEGGEVADFATAYMDADAAMGGGVIYYFTSTAADGGLLFYDANGDGTADGVVSLPGVDSSDFDDSNIV